MWIMRRVCDHPPTYQQIKFYTCIHQITMMTVLMAMFMVMTQSYGVQMDARDMSIILIG